MADNNEEIKEETGPEQSESPDEAKPGEGEPAPSNGEKKKKRVRLFIIGGAAVLVIALVGFVYWLYARQFESTDDAFIDGDIIQVSPKVSAYISKIYVSNNQLVHKGDLLVDLDPSDLNTKLEQAKAQLAAAESQQNQAEANAGLSRRSTSAAQKQARSNVQSARSNVDQTRIASEAKQTQVTQAKAVVTTAKANLAQTLAQVPQIQSNLTLAQKEYDRRKALFDKGDISQQSFEQGTNMLQAAQAQLNLGEKAVDAARSRVDESNAALATAIENYRQSVAQINVTSSQVGESQGRLEDANAAPERVNVSEAQVDTASAQIQAAQAAVSDAELQLSYAKIVAPEDGYITRKTVEEGQLVQVGTPLMAISQSDDVWVVANFKETQLDLMQVGQTVDIKVDAFPSESFRGKVDSIQAGTGSEFSLLPTENASGNYVKVVQRVPVKIVFEQDPNSKHRLVPGMSVEPSVKVR